MSSHTDTKEPSNTTKSKKKRLKFFLLCEVLVLAPILLIIVVLFLIPTIQYAFSSGAMAQNRTDISDETCSQVSEYSGEVCRDELMALQMCFSGVTSPLNIPSSIDQQAGESNTMSLVNGLSILNPSQQCSEAIMPFLCLSIFGLCDSSNTLHTILRQDCLDIRDDVCDSVWSQAVAFLGEGALPVCEDLPDVTVDCVDDLQVGNNQTAVSTSDSVLETTAGSSTTRSHASNNSSLECSNGFFFVENGCRPICTEFNPLPFASQILLKISFSIGFIACFIMLIMAVVIQRDTLLVFPSILLVYQCVPLIIFTGFTLVGFIDADLFCTSKDLLESLRKENEAPFCTITGIFSGYNIGQLCLLAVLHTVFLYWGVAFPFSYREFKTSGRIRYVHIICVVLTVVVPIPGGLVHLKDGYRPISAPTLACVGSNLDYGFYALILPISVAIAINSCLLVLTIWTIFKELVLKKLLAKRKVTNNIGIAEIKIIALTIYIIIMSIFGLVSFTNLITSDYIEDAAEFIVCESTGQEDCQEISDSFGAIKKLTTTFQIMLSIIPVALILFVCNPQAFKTKYKTWKSSWRVSSSTAKYQ